MAVSTIRLSPSQLDDIIAICDLGPDALSRVVKALQTRPLTIKSTALRQTIAAEIGEEPAKVMERFVLGVATTHRRRSMTTNSLLDYIQQSLASRFGADPTKMTKWKESRPHIERILCINSVELSAKAIDLSYDFKNIFIASRILTDIRPIFDDVRSEILGTTITQTLRMEYMSDGDQSSITIAMDMSDIRELEKVCKEALRKAEVSVQLVEQKWGLETKISGEDS